MGACRRIRWCGKASGGWRWAPRRWPPMPPSAVSRRGSPAERMGRAGDRAGTGESDLLFSFLHQAGLSLRVSHPFTSLCNGLQGSSGGVIQGRLKIRLARIRPIREAEVPVSASGLGRLGMTPAGGRFGDCWVTERRFAPARHGRRPSSSSAAGDPGKAARRSARWGLVEHRPWRCNAPTCRR